MSVKLEILDLQDKLKVLQSQIVERRLIWHHKFYLV